jgi:lipopolysaccharide/colanic/teichoic acid biosynthesis glycosyltransferase
MAGARTAATGLVRRSGFGYIFAPRHGSALKGDGPEIRRRNAATELIVDRPRADIMAQSARSLQPRENSRATRLRLYDPRISHILREVEEATPDDLPQPDVAAWLAGDRLLTAPGGNRSALFRLTKRVGDIVGALALLVLLGPLMLAVLAALTVTTRGRPLFRQKRVGHCGRIFKMYKFRTMRRSALHEQVQVSNELSGPIFKNRRDPRITRIGYVLRKLSIDEMPQLVNVLRGEMSLVGPRPAIPNEVAKYRTWQFQRLTVKPGLTCLWQVSGRCEIQSFDDWARLDLWYVRNQSLSVDLKLLAQTPLSVLSCRGAY